MKKIKSIPKDKKKKNILIFLKVWIKWMLIFTIVVYSWYVVHEGAHAIVCKLEGGKPALAQILPHPAINCEGIVLDGKLVISQTGYFFYAITPYILGLLVLIIIALSRKIHLALLALISMIMVDVSYNYLLSPFSKTDFTQLAIVSIPFFVFSWLIALSAWFLGFVNLKHQWEGLIRKKSINRRKS